MEKETCFVNRRNLTDFNTIETVKETLQKAHVKKADDTCDSSNSDILKRSAGIQVITNVATIYFITDKKTPTICSLLNSHVGTTDFPPPYAYKVPRKRKPPDKINLR